ncbi:MAG: pimeloyl-CoA dehydrogenase large subunit, partial [Gammaproteobacteria bacterium]|nr:pimeloyl-CoA dehydrogenase large subunit [Gammaproteobacteria bacterium]
MNVKLSAAELAFQQEVRHFFENEYPQDILDKTRRGIEMQREDYVRGQKALFNKGWAGINWPVEYGGTGWSATQKYVFFNEMARAEAPMIIPFGLGMVGPVIYTFGNEEQKNRFLPNILSSNSWWCQGYSEPGAGSDLASLKTRAVPEGDDYVVNGTKTWTTLAQYADWMFFLARTNSDVARRQEGISFFLVDMKTPGISITPIVTLDGDPEVNQVFFDNVRVPVANRIGEEGKGWTYAKMLLTHERTNISDVPRSKVRLAALKQQVRDGATL